MNILFILGTSLTPTFHVGLFINFMKIRNMVLGESDFVTHLCVDHSVWETHGS